MEMIPKLHRIIAEAAMSISRQLQVYGFSDGYHSGNVQYLAISTDDRKSSTDWFQERRISGYVLAIRFYTKSRGENSNEANQRTDEGPKETIAVRILKINYDGFCERRPKFPVFFSLQMKIQRMQMELAMMKKMAAMHWFYF